MPRTTLYATVGTNPAATISVLSAIYETLEYDEAILLATSVSKRFAEEARKRVPELLDHSRASKMVRIDELMDKAARDPVSVVNSLQGVLKDRLGKGVSIIIDVTGGTKLMTSLAAIAASISTSAARRARLFLTYTSSQGVDRLVAWWRSGEETGFYPRIPRLLARPVIYDLVAGSSREPCPNPTRLRTPQRLVPVVYRRGRGLQPLVEATALAQQLLNSVAESKADIYVRLDENSAVHVLTVSGLEYNPGEVHVEIEGLFNREEQAQALFEALRQRGEKAGSGYTLEWDMDFRSWFSNLRELVATVGLARLVVQEWSERCEEIMREKHEPLVDLLERVERGVKSGEGGRRVVWGDTNLAYLGVHNDVFELAWRMALRGERRGREGVEALRLPACAYREALTGYMERAKRGTSDPRALTASIASMAAEELMERGVDGMGSCEANMLMQADEKTILVTSDRGAFNAWREAEACAVRVAPQGDPKMFVERKGGDDRKEAEAIRALAAAAQLVAILATMLKDSNISLIVKGDHKTVEVRRLSVKPVEG